jgi:hypothetical protein
MNVLALQFVDILCVVCFGQCIDVINMLTGVLKCRAGSQSLACSMEAIWCCTRSIRRSVIPRSLCGGCATAIVQADSLKHPSTTVTSMRSPPHPLLMCFCPWGYQYRMRIGLTVLNRHVCRVIVQQGTRGHAVLLQVPALAKIRRQMPCSGQIFWRRCGWLRKCGSGWCFFTCTFLRGRQRGSRRAFTPVRCCAACTCADGKVVLLV